MSTTELKPLYMATSLEKIQAKSMWYVCKAAKNVFQEAEKYRLDYDEEKSFMLYMNYCTLIETIQKLPYFEKHQKCYKTMLGPEIEKVALNHIQKLKLSLNRRYKILEEEKVQERSEEVKEVTPNILKELKLNDNEEGKQDLAKDKKISVDHDLTTTAKNKLVTLSIKKKKSTTVNLHPPIVQLATSNRSQPTMLPAIDNTSMSFKQPNELKHLLYPMPTVKRLPKTNPNFKTQNGINADIDDLDYLDFDENFNKDQNKKSVQNHSPQLDFQQPLFDRSTKPLVKPNAIVKFPSNFLRILDQSLMTNGSSNKDTPQVDRSLKPKELETSDESSEEMKSILAKQQKVVNERLVIEKKRLEKEKDLTSVQEDREKKAEFTIQEYFERIEKLKLSKKQLKIVNSGTSNSTTTGSMKLYCIVIIIVLSYISFIMYC